MMTLSEAIAAGINVPAEMHAWSHIPEHERYIRRANPDETLTNS
jgi:hypothetical protein